VPRILRAIPNYSDTAGIVPLGGHILENRPLPPVRRNCGRNGEKGFFHRRGETVLNQYVEGKVGLG